MSQDFATVKNISIKKGDIVEVKFKPLDEVLDFYSKDGRRVAEIIDDLSIGYHLTSFKQGGFFYVERVILSEHDSNVLEHKKYNKEFGFPHEVVILDHNADNDRFTFNELFIESISVRDDVAESLFSDKFQISLLRIDGNLIINGHPVESSDIKLIEILEKVISDLSIKAMFNENEED